MIHLDEFTQVTRNGKTYYRKRHNDPSTKKNMASNELQGMYRWRMGNVINLWNAFKIYNWRPRYQNKIPGRTDYDEYKSLALQGQPIFLTKGETKDGASVLVPVTISSSSLPTIELRCDSVGVISDIAVGDLALTPDTTVGQLAHAIIYNNTGFLKGDILTFVAGTQQQDRNGGLPHALFHHVEIVLNPRDNTPLATLRYSQEAFAVRDGLLASTVSSGACAWVHCRPGTPKKKDDPDLYSTQVLWCSNQEVIDRYSGEEAFLRAGQSHKGPKKKEPLTPEHLNDDLAGRI